MTVIIYDTGKRYYIVIDPKDPPEWLLQGLCAGGRIEFVSPDRAG